MDLRSVAPAPVTAAPAAAAAARPTETQRALDAMTPQTRRTLPDNLLDAKIGKGTLAGGLNDQIRFRVTASGPMADREILPDSPLAHELMQTAAGAKLVRQLRTGVLSTGPLHDLSNLQGFILPRSSEAVLAGVALATIDSNEEDGAQLRRLAELNRVKVAGRVIRSGAHEWLDASLATAGAWNQDGWITFMPDTARGMLIASGAYDPNRHTERSLLKAGSWANYLVGNTSHEVQHSVSRPSPTAYEGDARWLEEGIANVLSRTPVIHHRNSVSSGVNAHRYAGHLAHEPAVDLGWRKWTRPTLPPDQEKKTKKEQQRNYGDSQVVLRDLVHLAGADFRSSAGIEQVRTLLQSKSMRFVPGVLANAIIEHNGLDPEVYDRLRGRIAVAVDIEGGVKALAAEFGIEA